MTAGYSTPLRNAQLDEITAAVGNAGLLRMYSGTRPATGAAITSQVLLAQLVCGTPFAPAAAAGVLTANPVSDDASANATGEVTWARIVTAAAAFVMDVDAGTELVMPNYNVTAGQTVPVDDVTITRGNA